MSNKTELYMPFHQWNLARRERLLPGQTYHPFTVKEEVPVIPCQGELYIPLDGNRRHCASIDEAVYVLYDARLPPPPGFVVVDCVLSPYGDMIPGIESCDNNERMLIWQNGAAALTSYSTPQNLPERTEENVVETSRPKVAFVKGTGEILSSSEETLESQYQLISGVDGYYLKAPKKETIQRVTNFKIHLLEIRHYISSSSSSSSSDSSGTEHKKIFFEVMLFDPIKLVQVDIPYEQLGQLLDIVRRKVGDANVFYHDRTFARRLDVLLRKELQDCKTTDEYTKSGWNTKPTGKWFYVNDNAIPPEQNIRFNCGFAFGCGPTVRSAHDIVLGAFDLLSLASDRAKIIIPFLWAHLGLLFSFLSELGYPPRTLLFINGISGSLKTAVAKLMFNFTAIPENDIPASFRDTSASMEINIAKYRDRVLLVDDYCPAANQASRRIMEQTLENLIRFYGDGNTKARATPSMDKAQVKKASGVCVITGEDTAGSLSSQLRCLFLTVEKGTYNGQVLQRFQDAPYLWTEYLELFTEYLLEIIPNLSNIISKRFPKYRQEIGKHLKERRLVDTGVTLMLVAQIVLEVAGKLSGENLTGRYKDEFTRAILQVCKESEARAKQQNPAKIFGSALSTMYQRKDIRLARVESSVDEPKAYLGAVKDNYWYLWPNETYRLVVQYYESGGQTFPLTQNALWAALDAAGVLVPTQTSRGKEKESLHVIIIQAIQKAPLRIQNHSGQRPQR